MVHLAYRLYLFYYSEKTCKWLEIKTRKNKVSAWIEGDTSPVIVTTLQVLKHLQQFKLYLPLS